MGDIAGQTMKSVEGNGPLAAWPFDVNYRIQCSKRDTHVGWMGGNTVFRGAQDGVHAVEPAGCVATRARDAFVAASRLVIKVVASGTLHQVAARRRHISDLARRTE